MSDHQEAIRQAILDELDAAICSVLTRHGYDLPGIANLCAMAAVRIMEKNQAPAPIPIRDAPHKPGMVFNEDLGWRTAEPIVKHTRDKPTRVIWVSPVDGCTYYGEATHWLPDPPNPPPLEPLP